MRTRLFDSYPTDNVGPVITLPVPDLNGNAGCILGLFQVLCRLDCVQKSNAVLSVRMMGVAWRLQSVRTQ